MDWNLPVARMLARIDYLTDLVFDPDKDKTSWATFNPIMDLIQNTEKGLEIQLDAPGFNAKDFKIVPEGDKLVVRAENKVRRFARQVGLPQGTDFSQAKARYRAGVLAIQVPIRTEASPINIVVDDLEEPG